MVFSGATPSVGRKPIILVLYEIFYFLSIARSEGGLFIRENYSK
jgi:hypothetical protein